MALRTVFRVVGILLIALAISMLLPALINLYSSYYECIPFVLSASITGFIGVLMMVANNQAYEAALGVREAFILTVLSWVFIGCFAALPFMTGYQPLSMTDAFFEATSALTTTGVTVMKNLDEANEGILLWRAILQWLGGVGIIVMALTVLPILKIGGMQLFRAESSDRSEKILPRVSQIATAIIMTQFVITLVVFLALWGAGMTAIEAICHAMAALATGGLSTSDSSVAYFQSSLIEMILVIAMIIGGCSMILFIRVWQGDWKALFYDRQVRGFLSVIMLSSAALTVWRYHIQAENFWNVLKESTFTVVSLITTTGFISEDYTKWGNFVVIMAFLLTFIGGCTGSTSGGLKIFRFQVLKAMVKAQIAQLRRPHGIFVPHYNNQPVSESVITSVFTFFALFGLSYALIALLLGLTDLDFITCLAASASALCNSGFGVGSLISSSGNYALLPDGAKWVLMLGMLLGRLEMMTIMVLFVPMFWKK